MREWAATLRELEGRLDLQRLSGVRSVLGIDLSETQARIVQVERKGNPVDRLKARFVPRCSFLCDLEPGRSPEEKGICLKEQLISRGLIGSYAVVGIHGRGVRTVRATIPGGTTDIQAWIRDHAEKLLRLPVQAGELTFRFAAIESEGENSVFEVTFVRRGELEAAALLAKSAGLELLALEPGVDSLLLAMLLGGGAEAPHEAKILYCDGPDSWVLDYKEGRKSSSRHAPLSEGHLEAGGEESSLASHHDRPLTEPRALIAGSFKCNERPPSSRPLEAFGLPAECALAAGLALHGLLKMSFEATSLVPDCRRRYEEKLYGSLWKRAVLAVGGTIFLMLALLAGGSAFLEWRIGQTEKEIASAGPLYEELRTLENAITSLKSRLRGGGATMRRSNAVKTLHEIASLLPQGLWFTKVEMNAGVLGEAELQIHGFARSHQEVSEFLRSLERSSLTRGVRLVRSGAPGPESATAGGYARKESVVFHIAATASI
jgi:hypothetical protein